MMIGHPGFGTLERFASGTATEREHTRTARHLLSCARCRTDVARLQRLSAVARLLPVPGRPPGGFSAVRRRIAAGEQLNLSQEALNNDVRIRRRRVPSALGAAAAIIIIGASTVFVTGVGRLDAADSTLEFSPAQPAAGAHIEVAYRGGGRLAGADRVLLRARLRRERDSEIGAAPMHVVVDTLTRTRDGTYRGSFRLPAGVVYAAFAIEDPTAERVDANDGRLWDLSVHGADGKPTYYALYERSADVRERNWEFAHGLATELVGSYPDSVRAWLEYWLLESQRTSPSGQAVLERRKLQEFERLHALYSTRPDLPARTAADMWYYAWSLSNAPMRAGSGGDDNPDGAGTAMEYWRERVFAASSADDRVLMVRSIYNIMENLGAPRRGLAVVDSLWHVGGPSVELVGDADLLARRSRDRAEIRRWLLRAVEADPAAAASTGRRLLDLGGHEIDAIELFERALARFDNMVDAGRPLHTARAVYREDIAVRRGRVLADLARGHVAVGNHAAARDALREAAALPWDAALLAAVGDGLLAIGDTTAAVRELARLAADPIRSDAFADSLRGRAGPVDDQTWTDLVAAGRVEMTTRIIALADPRPLRSRNPIIASADGREVDLASMMAGQYSVVSFWSRRCGYALNESARLQWLQAELRTRGFVHEVVTESDSPEAVSTALAEWRASGLDVSYDLDGSAALAFNAWGTPEHYIVDPRGVVRYGLRGAGRIDEALRIVTVLAGSGAGSTVHDGS